MKKTLFFGLMAAALGFTACSDENGSIFNEKPQKGMTLNATVNGGIDTRATIVNTDAVWPFTFSAGDEVKVTNDLVSDTYTFSKSASYFTCDDATPTTSATTWHAYYPSSAIDLTNQSGTIADVAAKYALSGATETATTGSPSLSIDMKAKVAILKIVNAGGDIDINIKNSSSTWVTGLTADAFNVTSSSTKNSILTTSTAGSYYVVVPAGVQLVIKDEDTAIKSTKSSGFEAGKYYTLTVGLAPWETRLTKGRSSANKIEIETGIETRPADAADLNAEGTLWETLSSDEKTLKIQTPCKKIIGRNSFDTRDGLFADYSFVTEITGLEKVDMSDVTDMNGMFSGCMFLSTVDVSSFNTEKVTDMSSMFMGCFSLSSLDVTHFNTANVLDMSDMFSSCRSLTSIDVTHFNTEKVTDMSQMFSLCTQLTTLDVTHFNTANVTEMANMFALCQVLSELNVTHFDTEKVTSFYGTFFNCKTLTTLDVSNFVTSSATNMGNMFTDCQSLTSLDVTNFNTEKVEYMQGMFHNCKTLTTLNVSNFNTANVTDMDAMFHGCEGLTTLVLTNFNTEKVVKMSGMFWNSYNLESLDLSSFNTSNVSDMSHMFGDIHKLASLKLSNNFTFTSVTKKEKMFFNCGKDVVGYGIISNVTDDSIKTNCKENDNSDSALNTSWGTSGFNMKFEGE